MRRGRATGVGIRERAALFRAATVAAATATTAAAGIGAGACAAPPSGDGSPLGTIDASAWGGADGGGDSTAGAPPLVSPVRTYQSTASVGDFLSLTLDTSTQTVSYVNRTNGLAADGVPYTVDPTGVYSFAADPNGHLRQGIELAGVAFVLDVDRGGPARDTRALAIGAAPLPLSAAAVADARRIAMQFRTRNGGMEVGDVAVSTASAGAFSVSAEEYWPRGAMAAAGQAFQVGGPAATLAIAGDAGSDDFLALEEQRDGAAGGLDYLFKTASGLALDLDTGSLFLVDEAAQPAFDPGWAGDYRALLYEKTDASGGADEALEPGTAQVTLAAIRVDGSGQIAIADETGAVLAQGALTPVASAAYLTGPGRLDPASCNGLFTLRTPAGGGFRDVFVAFTAQGLLVTSFTPGASDAGGGDSGAPDTYDYFYGAALKH